MRFEYDDGGRAAAGYKGAAGDCVCRAICIATGKPYQEVYAALSKGMGNQRTTRGWKSKGATARNGVSTSRKWFKDYMKSLGFTWVPTMGIGTGCKVHLTDGELPMGRIVARVSKHLTAVLDGVPLPKGQTPRVCGRVVAAFRMVKTVGGHQRKEEA